MDKTALAEDIVDLYEAVRLAYHHKYGQDAEEATVISLFERAHTFIIHKNIQKERSGVPSKQKKKPFKKKAGEGRPVSQKQRDFIEDLGGDPDQVDTSKEASDYIEELKGD